MRIGFRKKVGKMYISGSTNTKQINKGILAVLSAPFYAAYYVCIYPFLSIYKRITGKKQKHQANINAQLKTFDESFKTAMSTTNPELFFQSYEKATQTVNTLSALTSDPVVHGASPQDTIAMLNSDKTNATNAFLDRYAKETRLKAFELTRGRKAKIESFKLITDEYLDKMASDNIAYRDTLYDDMISKLET